MERITDQIIAAMVMEEMTFTDLAAVTGISRATLWRRTKHPENWTLREMTTLSRYFGIVFEVKG